MEVQATRIKPKSKSAAPSVKRFHGRLYEAQPVSVRSILHGSRVQPRLRIGQPNDKFEQEADRVVEQVMRMPEPQSQVFSSVDNPPLGSNHSNSGAIQRTCASYAEDEELVQAKTNGDIMPEVTPVIGAGIQSLQGSGQPLSESDRSFFEPRIGADFSNVRVHRDSKAASLARSINARAFTHGHEVVFGTGEYSPNTRSGKKLLAHELTHVVQQKGSDLPQAATSLRNNLKLKAPIESDHFSNARAFTVGQYAPESQVERRLLGHELTHTVQQGERTKQGQIPYIQRAVNTQPFTVVPDIDPASHLFGGNDFMGITIPNLNGSDNISQPATFIRMLRLPTLAERDLRKIPRPDLSSSILNSVRTGKSLVRFGRAGTQVKLVQEALVAWGHSLSPPVNLLSVFGADGIFGSETKGAVEAFQSAPAHLLSKDGLVGEQTLQALETAMASLHVSEFTIDTVPTNDLTGTIRIPMAPAAWTAVATTRVDLISQLPLAGTSFGSCPSGTAIIFRIVPGPGIVPDTLKHEQVHEADITNTVRTELGPWDSGLELLRLIQIPFRGVDAPSVSAAVFASFPGATPCDIATIIPVDWSQKNFNFHTSSSGFGTDLTNMVLGTNCRTVTFTAMNATTPGTVHPPRTGAPCNAIVPDLAVTRQIPVPK